MLVGISEHLRRGSAGKTKSAYQLLEFTQTVWRARGTGSEEKESCPCRSLEFHYAAPVHMSGFFKGDYMAEFQDEEFHNFNFFTSGKQRLAERLFPPCIFLILLMLSVIFNHLTLCPCSPAPRLHIKPASNSMSRVMMSSLGTVPLALTSTTWPMSTLSKLDLSILDLL